MVDLHIILVVAMWYMVIVSDSIVHVKGQAHPEPQILIFCDTRRL